MIKDWLTDMPGAHFLRTVRSINVAIGAAFALKWRMFSRSGWKQGHVMACCGRKNRGGWRRTRWLLFQHTDRRDEGCIWALGEYGMLKCSPFEVPRPLLEEGWHIIGNFSQDGERFLWALGMWPGSVQWWRNGCGCGWWRGSEPSRGLTCLGTGFQLEKDNICSSYILYTVGIYWERRSNCDNSVNPS